MRLENAGTAVGLIGLAAAAMLFAYGSAQRTLVVGDGVIYRFNPITGFEAFCSVEPRRSRAMTCFYPASQRRAYQAAERKRAAGEMTPEQAAAAREARFRGLTP